MNALTPQTSTLTIGQRTAQDVSALLRARTPLLWIVTKEEARVETLLFEAAASAGYLARIWDVAQGARAIGGQPISSNTEDPGAMLQFIANQAASTQPGRSFWIMRDLDAWLRPLIGIATLRQLRNLARLLPTIARDKAQAVCVLTTSTQVPDELAGHATVIEWPLPDRNEIAAILDAAIAALPTEIKEAAAPNGTRDAAIDAAIGLTGEEAASCYTKSLVQTKRIDPAAVSQEKRRVIARERVLEWYDPLPGGLRVYTHGGQLLAHVFAIQGREQLPTVHDRLLVSDYRAGPDHPGISRCLQAQHRHRHQHYTAYTTHHISHHSHRHLP